jgi:hypothetical protein
VIVAILTSSIETEQRYGALRFISALFSLIGIVLTVIGTLLLVVGLYALLTEATRTQSKAGNLFPAHEIGQAQSFLRVGGAILLIWSVALVLGGLQYLAFGVLCKLAIHLEANTRVSAQALDRIRSRLEQSENVNDPFFRS